MSSLRRVCLLALLSPGLAHALEPSPAIEVAVGPVQAPPSRAPERARSSQRPPGQEEVQGFVLLGLRGEISQNAGSDSGHGGSTLVLGALTFTEAERKVLFRERFDFSAGYGKPGGFLGEARFAMGIGPRLSRDRHAPAMLFGLEALALRGPTFYHSLVEVPQVAVAYHRAGADLAVEVGMRLGYVTVGRFNPGDQTRKLGKGGALGLYATASWGRGFAEVDYRMVRPLDGAPTRLVHLGRLSLCAGSPGAVCATGMLLRGDVVGGDRPATSVLLGLSVGASAGPPDAPH